MSQRNPDSRDVRETRGKRWGAHAVLAALIAFVTISHPVWTAAPLDLALDPSWRAALHHAFAHGWLFGTDIVFPFGPYGSLAAHVFDPQTFSISVAINLALAITAVVAIWHWSRHLGVHRGWAALAIVLLADGAQLEPDAWFIPLTALPLLWIWGASSRPPGAAGEVLLHALAVSLACVGWIKHSYGIGSLAVAVACTIGLLVRRERPWFALSYAAAVIATWFAAGQTVSNVAPFATSTLSLLGGYAEAMSLSGPGIDVLLMASSTAACVGVAGFHFHRIHGRVGWVPTLAVLGLATLLLKAAIVRQDVMHFHYLAGGLTGIYALMGISSLARWPFDRSSAIAVALALALHGSIGLVVSARHAIEPRYPQSMVLRWIAPETPLVRGWRTIANWHQLADRQADAKRQIRASVQLPALEGAVDVVPDYLSIALAYEFDYRPRPVIQSYAAYSPDLLARNRRFFEGARAPRYLVHDVALINDRLPALLDGPCWPAWLTRYRIVAHSRDFNLLEREDEPRTLTRRTLDSSAIELGRTVQIPPTPTGDVLWARIDLARTAAGSLLSAAFRPPTVFAHLTTSDGQTHRYRLVPGMARAGFVLSPLIRTPSDFRQLATRRAGALWRDQSVTTVRLEIANEVGASFAYRPVAAMDLEHLRWDRR